MCACFDLGYILSDISDDGRTASTVRRDTSQDYQRFCLESASLIELCECVRQRIPASISTTDVWRRVTLIPLITQAWNTVNWGMCYIP